MNMNDINDLLGKWDGYYSVNHGFNGMGSESTYKIGMEFLSDCVDIEDWGGGIGYSRKYCKTQLYKSIDGSRNSGANVITDLRYYKSSADGIFIRHVLDHNPEWELILKNAIESSKKKLCVIIGSTCKEITKIVNIIESRCIADIEFKKEDIEKHFLNLNYNSMTVDGEQIFLITKSL